MYTCVRVCTLAWPGSARGSQQRHVPSHVTPAASLWEAAGPVTLLLDRGGRRWEEAARLGWTCVPRRQPGRVGEPAPSTAWDGGTNADGLSQRRRGERSPVRAGPQEGVIQGGSPLTSRAPSQESAGTGEMGDSGPWEQLLSVEPTGVTIPAMESRLRQQPAAKAGACEGDGAFRNKAGAAWGPRCDPVIAELGRQGCSVVGRREEPAWAGPAPRRLTLWGSGEGSRPGAAVPCGHTPRHTGGSALALGHSHPFTAPPVASQFAIIEEVRENLDTLWVQVLSIHSIFCS